MAQYTWLDIERLGVSEKRLDKWRTVLAATEGLPPVFGRSSPLDDWNELSVPQRGTWLGRLFFASIPRQAGITTQNHLDAMNLGLKTISVDRCRHCDC